MAQDQDLLNKVKTAREEGHTDAEIANFIAKSQGKGKQLSIARKEGKSDANIINFLTTGKEFQDIGHLEALGQGVETGLIDVISGIGGAPLDLVAAIGTKLTGKPLDPIGGSRSIRRGFENIGVGPEVKKEDIEPSKRPLFVGGEVIGGGLPFAGVGGVLARGGQGVAKLLTTEAAALGGAGLGGTGAEFVDPDDPLTRFLSEVGGGIFSPIALSSRFGGKGVSSVKRLFKSWFGAGKEDEAAKFVKNIIDETGENPEDIIKLLNKADIEGVRLTPAQKTGSPALLMLENKLASKSSRFAGEVEDAANSSLAQLRKLTDDLTKSGNPEALKVAAKLRAQYFDDLLDRRLQDAGQDALEKRAAIGTGTKADLANVSASAKASLSNALKDARAVETAEWAKIPKGTPLAPDNTIMKFDDIKSRLLPEESLPPLAEKFVSRMRGLQKANKVSNAGELLTFRSRMLSKARDATAKGDFGEASQFSQLAEGALDDLTKLPGGEADAARAFSRQLHEKFTDTFAGKVLAKNSAGGERIPAEVMLERAFGSGGTKGDLQLRQLSEAASFPKQIFGEPMLDQQEKFLQIAAQNTVDDTGRVNPTKLRAFLDKNQSTLERFPDLKRNLSDAVTAEDTFRGVEQAVKTETTFNQKRSAFANVLKVKDPVVSVGDVLSGKDTRANYREIAKLAKNSGQGSVAGLRSATLKNVFDKSADANGAFSFKRLDQILKKGLSKEDQGILSLMRQNGIIDKAGVDRLNTLTRRAIDIEDALGNQKKLDKLLDSPDAMFDLVTRIVGSRVGAAGAVGAASGSSLVAAGAGVRAVQSFASKIPVTKVTEVLELAAKDQKLMALLLKKTPSIKQRLATERQINAFLVSAGLQLEEDE